MWVKLIGSPPDAALKAAENNDQPDYQRNPLNAQNTFIAIGPGRTHDRVVRPRGRS
jgi:hypothetical protein